MNYYLGIDIGTSFTKAVAFDAEGGIVASLSAGYTIQHPQPGYSEQDPVAILDAVITLINAVTNELGAPAFISFSAAMHSLILIGKEGAPLTQCIIWADNRAVNEAAQLRESERASAFYQQTGVPIHPMSPLCKLLWFSENEPGLFQSAYKFIGIKEFVFYHLTGQYVIDSSCASATGLFDIHTLQWSNDVLQYAGIAKERLATIVPATHVIPFPAQNNRVLLQKDVPLVLGASDGALANVGSGATASHIMAVSIGTSNAARVMVNAPVTDVQMRTFCYHVKGSQYIAGGASNNGAVVLQWLKESILNTRESYETLFDEAANVPAGSDGLLFLPYILGERAPIWNAHAKGVFMGLGIQHTHAHLLRAAMEGVINVSYSIGKILAEKKEITEIHASGGFTKTPLWVQMLADMFDKKVIVSENGESAALGAVIVGAEALALPFMNKQVAGEVYEPVKAQHITALERFQAFERLYTLLKNEFNSTLPASTE